MKFSGILISVGLTFSSIALAAPVQQTIILKNSVAQVISPLKLDCTDCSNLKQQSEHVYLVEYATPNPVHQNHLYFTYQYGPYHDSCIYNADVRFYILPENNVGFWCNGAQFALLSSESTSQGCPHKILIDVYNNKDLSIRLDVDW